MIKININYKKSIFLLLLGLSLFLLGSPKVYSQNDYINYQNDIYQYKLFIPALWSKVDYDLGYKNILVLNRNDKAKIKITASRMIAKEKAKWQDWKSWYLKGVGKNLTNILETNEIVSKNKFIREVLIFEYQDRQKKIMQKVYLGQLDNLFVAIECSSSQKDFYSYNNIFNTVIKSLGKI